jgi:hypothetical protein
MISQSDFHYELIVDIMATSLFALLFIIILLLNYFNKSFHCIEQKTERESNR